MNKELIKTIMEINKKLETVKLKELELRGITGFAPSHGDILVSLFTHGDLSMKELAEKINKDKSTVTALINKLLKLGYVEKYKDPTDSRVHIAKLTPFAYERREDFIEVSNIIIDKVSRHVTEKEVESTLQILNKINSGF